jgi:hypothetical protein
MSIFIQEVLGLLKRNQKKIILDKNKDWFEFGKLYQTSNLNTGAAYNPKMEPFVIKWGDIVCQVTEDLTRTLPGEGKPGYVPVYTDPSGFCSWDTLKGSIITQNALNTIITIGGNLVVTGDAAINGGDLTTTASTFNLINTNATTINFAGAGTSLSIGAATGTTTINNANTIVAGDLAVNGCDLTSTCATFNLLNTAPVSVINFGSTTTNIEVGGAATVVNVNGTTESTSCTTGALVIDGGVGIAKNLNVCGNLTVSGTSNLNGNVNLGNTLTDQIKLFGTLLDNNLNPALTGQVLIGQTDGFVAWTTPPWITSFTVAGDTVGTLNITDGNTLSILGGTGINTALSTIDTVTINHDDYGTAGTYAFPSSITTNAQGHITSITAGTGGSGVTQIVAGTNITISPTGGTGVVTINSTATSSTTASNGLTMSTATNVILGGALGQNTTITSSGFSLTAANNTAVTAFTGQNLSSGKGLLGTSASGVGVTGTSETFRAGQFSISPLSDDTVAENTIFQRTVASNASGNNGIGQSLIFEQATKNGSLANANNLISKFTSTADLARTSEFSITGVNAGVTGNKLILSGNGTLRLPDYGVGNKPGTSAYSLSVTSTGNVIETAVPNFAPKVYVSMLVQSGNVDPPSTTLIFNNIADPLGVLYTFTWSRISAGLYELTCSGPIFSAKAAIFATPDIADRPYFISLERIISDATKMRLNCFNPTTANSEDDLLNYATFKIELYDNV